MPPGRPGCCSTPGVDLELAIAVDVQDGRVVKARLGDCTIAEDMNVAVEVVPGSEAEQQPAKDLTALVGAIGPVMNMVRPRVRDQHVTIAPVKAMDVSSLDANLLDAVVRLVRLLDSPTDFRVLAPLVPREIVHRRLLGAQGDRLRQIALLDGYTHRPARLPHRAALLLILGTLVLSPIVPDLVRTIGARSLRWGDLDGVRSSDAERRGVDC